MKLNKKVGKNNLYYVSQERKFIRSVLPKVVNILLLMTSIDKFLSPIN